MKAAEIENERWYVFTAKADYVYFGVGSMGWMRDFRFTAGVKGYVCRNAHSPNYYQIVAPLSEGQSVGGWYLKEVEVDKFCEITIPAPRFAKPGKHWSAWWKRRRY